MPSNIIFRDTFPIEDIKEAYCEHGFVVLKNFFDISKINQVVFDIHQLINLQIENESPVSLDLNGLSFSESIVQLSNLNRGKLGSVYDSAIKLVSLKQLCLSDKIVKLVQDIHESKLIAQTSNTIVRFDLKGEEKFLFDDWHQDYPYSMVSKKGSVVWAPLVNISEAMGPVRVIPGSHLDGIKKVRIDERGYMFVNESEFIKSLPEDQSFACEVGDLVLFNILSFHRSGINNTNSPRVSLSFRYCDLNDKELINDGWPSFYTQGKHFRHVYPDLVNE